VPWLGYFSKIAQSDVFVVLDDAQYSKNSFINRNRIKTAQGVPWLTIPVCTSGRSGAAICEITTDLTQKWPEKHLSTLHGNYRRARHCDEVMDAISPVYRTVTPATTLAEFNLALIRTVCALFGMSQTIVLASELSVCKRGTERLVDIVGKVGGTVYLSGKGGMKYQDEEVFTEAGLGLRYLDFAAPEYPQLWGAFSPGLSVLDALMNMGADARELLMRKAA
jgi:WbqC-like protein